MAINNLAHDVLILGGGHAGVRAARQLIRRQRPGERLDVALVSRDNVELWHGLMPQMLANTVQPEHVVVPLREVLKGVSIYVYEIPEIDQLVGLSLPLYPHLSRPQLRIISVDPGTRVLPSMSERVSAMAYENLT